jgi:hypothetical protein
MKPLFILVLLLPLSLAGCERQRELAPDIAFNFRCKGAAYPASEPAMESFLIAHGFAAFNEERVRKQYNLRLYPLAVDGFDKKKRILDFRGINEKAGDKPEPIATIYSVGLYSPPPTAHDAALEQAMLDFVANDLKCAISQVSHGTNGPERVAFFATVYKAEQKRIADGRKCDKASGRQLDTHCPS